MVSPGAVLDLVLGPLDAASPQLGIGAAALATAALAVPVFRLATRPRALGRARDRMVGDLLGAVVYRHDAVVVLASLARFATSLARYLGHTILPLALLALPLGLLFHLLDSRYGFLPYREGDVVVVSAPAAPGPGRPALETSPGLRPLTPAVRLPEGGHAWRVRVEREGVHEVRVAGETARLVAASGASKDAFGPLEIDYPAREIAAGDVLEPWYVYYLADVLVLGWALGATFGVRF